MPAHTSRKSRKSPNRHNRSSAKRWSGRVTRESNALDLDREVFTLRDPRKIASSLKRSAERSKRRKADPFRSALSMLTFYINRGGKNLPESRKRILERAKQELRRQFGRA
jgi:hypothetical protein